MMNLLTSQNSLLPKSTNSDFLALHPNAHATNPHEWHWNQVSYSSLKHLSTAALSVLNLGLQIPAWLFSRCRPLLSRNLTSCVINPPARVPSSVRLSCICFIVLWTSLSFVICGLNVQHVSLFSLDRSRVCEGALRLKWLFNLIYNILVHLRPNGGRWESLIIIIVSVSSVLLWHAQREQPGLSNKVMFATHTQRLCALVCLASLIFFSLNTNYRF